ncbi:MAG: hypothetical protein AB7O26_18615, partial [Planctomycetaceae bacterium]
GGVSSILPHSSSSANDLLNETTESEKMHPGNRVSRPNRTGRGQFPHSPILQIRMASIEAVPPGALKLNSTISPRLVSIASSNTVKGLLKKAHG